MSKHHLYLLTAMLTAIGLVLFFYKLHILEFPLVPDVKTHIWSIEAQLTFEAEGKPVKVSMFIPRNSHRFTIVDENFVSRGYGINISTEDGKRQVHWSIRNAKGLQSLYYRASVRRIEREVAPLKSPGSDLKKPDFKGAYLEASMAIISEVRDKSADVDSTVTGLLQRINHPQPDGNVALLLGKNLSAQKKVDLAVQLLAMADIHARVVHGIRLEEQHRNAPVLHWLEVFDNQKWLAYDPATQAKGIPDEYLPWWRGMEPLVAAQGVRKLAASFSLVRGEETAVQAALGKGELQKSFLLDFSLFSLPIQTQVVYHVILMVPIGILLLVILRNVIGIRTFGTFMPVLIALAFRETKLIWGVILFTTLIGIGLLIRLYLEHLKLLVIPRLAAIVIVVIGLMALLSVLTHKLGLERGLSVALFPMVIVTMTIERMSIIWEELGALETIKQGFGSILAAILVYLVMTIRYLEYLVFVFPELLLVLLAGIILLGRYSGYRLLELHRFKALTEKHFDV